MNKKKQDLYIKSQLKKDNEIPQEIQDVFNSFKNDLKVEEQIKNTTFVSNKKSHIKYFQIFALSGLCLLLLATTGFYTNYTTNGSLVRAFNTFFNITPELSADNISNEEIENIFTQSINKIIELYSSSLPQYPIDSNIKIESIDNKDYIKTTTSYSDMLNEYNTIFTGTALQSIVDLRFQNIDDNLYKLNIFTNDSWTIENLKIDFINENNGELTYRATFSNIVLDENKQKIISENSQTINFSVILEDQVLKINKIDTIENILDYNNSNISSDENSKILKNTYYSIYVNVKEYTNGEVFIVLNDDINNMEKYKDISTSPTTEYKITNISQNIKQIYLYENINIAHQLPYLIILEENGDLKYVNFVQNISSYNFEAVLLSTGINNIDGSTYENKFLPHGYKLNETAEVYEQNIDTGSINIIDYIKTNKNTESTSTPNIPVYSTIYGDVNLDGSVNMKDINYFNNYLNKLIIFNEQSKSNADVNLDNVLDYKDVDLINKYIVGGYNITLPTHSSTTDETIDIPITTQTLYGDVNLDNKITTSDQVLILRHIENIPQYILSGQSYTNADVNLDGLVDIKDSNLLSKFIVGGWITHLPYTNLLFGDINLDDDINMKDVTILNRYINNTYELNEESKLNADINLDNILDNKDVEILQKFIMGGTYTSLPVTE